MLEFSKLYVDGEDKSDVNSGYRTYFTITSDGLTMVATRIILMKSKRLVFTLDGTIGSVAKKVNDTTKMLDEDFAMFSDIQFATINENSRVSYIIPAYTHTITNLTS